MSSDTQHAWAAGFFDGEGCVRIRLQTHGRAFAVGLGAVQVQKAPIELLQGLYGGVVRRRVHSAVNQRSSWEWELSGAKAVCVALEAMQPYLVVKRRHAEVALRYCGLMRARRGWPRLSQDEFAQRQECADEMARLNRRGPGGEVCV